MATSYPLYGSIQLDENLTISSLIERLQKVSSSLLQKAHFGAYLVVKGGQRYYGLEEDEVLSLYQDLGDEIKNLALSLSDLEGCGVRINLQYIKAEQGLKGQYVITTYQHWKNKEIQNILLGMWKPRPQSNAELMKLLLLLKTAKEKEMTQKQKAKTENVFRGELFFEESSFYIDPELSFQRIWDLLEELSVVFFHGSSFQFRLGTTDGDYFVDLEPTQLKQLFRTDRSRIHTLYIDASTIDGQRIDLSLRFHKSPSRPNGMIEVTAFEAQEITAYVLDTLSRKREQSLKHSTIFQQKFSFDREEFSIETLLHLINAIAGTYFKGINATADLFTISEKSFTQLSVKQLKEAYYRNEKEIKKIGIYVSEGHGRNFFFLQVNWSTTNNPHGEMQMLLGDEERHQTVRDLIWQKLRLIPETLTPENPNGESSHNISPHSIFRQHIFRQRGTTCFVIMPLETYWTEPIWSTLKNTLTLTGFDEVERGVSLNQTEALEENWEKINEAQWILADLTYRQPYVFYWIGIAHALGKKVLLMSQHKRDIPNSLSQLPYLLYENNLEGLEKLQLDLIAMLKYPKDLKTE